MITGDNFGVVQGFALLDVSSGKSILFSDLAEGGATGPKGDKGDKGDPGLGIKTITAAAVGQTVTLTFTMDDNTTKTASFDLP